MARWIEKLQNYEFQIEHRKGQLHNNADALANLIVNIAHS